MNISSVVIYQDSASSAVAKNVIIVAVGLAINYINGTLVHTYRKHQVFYTNPRYILFVHLVLNDMFQLSISICLYLLRSSEFHASVCIVILCISVLTTHITPLNLAVMAVECYVAVCFPLRHAELCTIRRTYALIGGVWVLSSMTILPDVFIIVAVKPAKFFASEVKCERTNVFAHSIILLKRDILYITYLSGMWLILIYTYCHIFFAAKAAKSTERESKKARNTILLHGFQLLLCTLTYLFHIIVRGFVYWFVQHTVHIAFVSYVFIIILPRLINPILYGLRDKTFRQHLKKYLYFTRCDIA